MGSNWRPETVLDLGRREFDVAVRCLNCDRTAVYDVGEIFQHFSQRSWSVRWPITAAHFVCRCRSKDLIVEMSPRWRRPDPLPPRTEHLRPLYVRPSLGWNIGGPASGTEPEVIRYLRELVAEDATKRFAWRVLSKAPGFYAEVICGAAHAGEQPCHIGRAATEAQALARAVQTTVSYWRAGNQTRHKPLSEADVRWLQIACG